MSAPINDGGSAFPCGEDASSLVPTSSGMSLRDYFAARAPEMPIAFERLPEKWETRPVNAPKPGSPDWHEMRRVLAWKEDDTAYLCRWRYAYADAMLAVREGSK